MMKAILFDVDNVIMLASSSKSTTEKLRAYYPNKLVNRVKDLWIGT